MIFGIIKVIVNVKHFQLTAYSSIYGMALLCIIVGSIRSLYFVQKHIRKKRLIETSITVNEAKKFPLTASCVLFGLYIFFKFVLRLLSHVFFLFGD